MNLLGCAEFAPFECVHGGTFLSLSLRFTVWRWTANPLAFPIGYREITNQGAISKHLLSVLGFRHDLIIRDLHCASLN